MGAMHEGPGRCYTCRHHADKAHRCDAVMGPEPGSTSAKLWIRESFGSPPVGPCPVWFPRTDMAAQLRLEAEALDAALTAALGDP